MFQEPQNKRDRWLFSISHESSVLRDTQTNTSSLHEFRSYVLISHFWHQSGHEPLETDILFLHSFAKTTLTLLEKVF